jgi:hypothetical protein
VQVYSTCNAVKQTETRKSNQQVMKSRHKQDIVSYPVEPVKDKRFGEVYECMPWRSERQPPWVREPLGFASMF